MEFRRPVGVVAVALLVVTAGCSAVFGGNSTPNRDPYGVPASTTTETATETRTSTSTLGTLRPTETGTVVPGVGRDRVESALDVISAHTAFLNRQSYHVDHTVRVTAPRGDLESLRSVEAWVGPNRTTYYAVRRGEDPLELYADGSLSVARRPDDGNASYELLGGGVTEIPAPGGSLGTDLTYRGRIYNYLSSMDRVSVDDIPNGSDGVRRYQFSSMEVEPSNINTRLRGTVGNVSVIVTIDERGLVERLIGIYTLQRDGRQFQVFERLRFETAGRTTVPTPDWIEEARNATNASSLGRTGNVSG